mgnify:FL=1|jgi:hypothetical protein
MVFYTDLNHHQRSLVDLGLILHVVYTLSNLPSLSEVSSCINVTTEGLHKHIIYTDEYGNCLEFELSTKICSSKANQVIRFMAFHFYHVCFPDNKLTVDLGGQILRSSDISFKLTEFIWYKIFGESSLLMKRLLFSRDDFLACLNKDDTELEVLIQTYVDKIVREVK